MKECENCRKLRGQIQRLEDRLQWLESKPILKRGFDGERLVSRIVDGIRTIHTCPHDVKTPRGTLLEVKFSSLRFAVKGEKTKRWSWGHVKGASWKKIYTRLILVGETDPDVDSDIYPPGFYVFFDVPFAQVDELARADGSIQISTNPETARTEPARLLFQNYLTSMEILSWRYGL